MSSVKLKQLCLAAWLLAAPYTASADSYGITLLQEAIYHEARGEGFDGMVAVGQVVMNRVASKRFPYTIRTVIIQRKQFSYRHVIKNHAMKEKYSERLAFFVAIGVYSGIYYKSELETSVMYHVCEGKRKVKPRWDWRKLSFDGKIGKHCFYSYKLKR